MTNEELVEKFNAKYPVGSIVKWRSINRPNYLHREYLVRSAAKTVNRQAVAFLEGVSGSVSIEPGFVDYQVTPFRLDTPRLESLDRLINEDRQAKKAQGI